jgi:hypothetical protein
MIFLPGVLVGRLSDLGYFQATFATGSVLIIAGTFLIPVCTLYWHFLLCQGFMIGVSKFRGISLASADDHLHEDRLRVDLRALRDHYHTLVEEKTRACVRRGFLWLGGGRSVLPRRPAQYNS